MSPWLLWILVGILVSLGLIVLIVGPWLLRCMAAGRTFGKAVEEHRWQDGASREASTDDHERPT